ncbi:DUF4389 domain-containing protein [Nocardia seriolae]|uniref:Uncharacterized protein n=1 Tax=Nocardia seriolae TaxID=37332 RepID=A0A0B8NHT8_9NOCA|nr:DUF4389 domain-containing protein [Nocardia seriolae]APA95745.1 hypothetical protein NS506_01676 [Nocardia seriolae]MTJ66139.1 DUF4389 domain-containing protein [Nocardia seriolae]MTJ73256.1 DUF4389 domain-containing protein [Nocardia seriolae]MTJ85946.1 DUF4389 domain-containing protein [Nocardia seriolae]MTK29940.1 DUF4389 domain-containing protein [Nocardia seriolae]
MAEYPAVEPTPEPIVGLDVFPPEQQRRWTVLLRAILAVPHLLILIVIGLASAVVAFLGWFGALFTGALPAWCGDFLRATLAYTIRVLAYMYLLVDAYPPFSLDVDANYPVRVQFPAPTRLNRWAVFFRFILAIPILAFTSWLSTGWTVIAVIIWLIMLVTGRMPAAVFQATAAVLRCQVRTDAYWLMLTPTYLTQPFGDGPVPAPGEVPPPGFVPASPTRPLLVSQAAKVLLWVILILGILWSIFNPGPDYSTDDQPTPTHIEWPQPTP